MQITVEVCEGWIEHSMCRMSNCFSNHQFKKTTPLPYIPKYLKWNKIPKTEEYAHLLKTAENWLLCKVLHDLCPLNRSNFEPEATPVLLPFHHWVISATNPMRVNPITDKYKKYKQSSLGITSFSFQTLIFKSLSTGSKEFVGNKLASNFGHCFFQWQFDSVS